MATELLARDISGGLPFDLQRAVLTNGSVIIERASLRRSQKILRGPLGPLFARLTNKRRFIRGIRRTVQRAAPAVRRGGEAQWALLAARTASGFLHLLCAYLNRAGPVRPALARRGAGLDQTAGLLWATGDPVATTNVLEACGNSGRPPT